MKRAVPSARRPDRTRVPARIAGGGVLAALLAAEASAHGETEMSLEESFGDAPAAASLEDILRQARVCATRPSFADAWGHDHEPFAPRFLHEQRFTSRSNRQDCHDRGEEGAAQGDTSRAHAGHSAETSESGPIAPSFAPLGHPAGHEVATADFEAPALHDAHFDAVLAAHRGHDLNEGIEALLAMLAGRGVVHAHDAPVEAPPVEAESVAEIPLAESSEPAAAEAPPAPAGVPAVSHHAHGLTAEGAAETVIVTVEI